MQWGIAFARQSFEAPALSSPPVYVVSQPLHPQVPLLIWAAWGLHSPAPDQSKTEQLDEKSPKTLWWIGSANLRNNSDHVTVISHFAIHQKILGLLHGHFFFRLRWQASTGESCQITLLVVKHFLDVSQGRLRSTTGRPSPSCRAPGSCAVVHRCGRRR